MKHFIDFVEKHKGFFKKLAIIAIFAVITTLLKNPAITQLFYQLFGSELAVASVDTAVTAVGVATLMD